MPVKSLPVHERLCKQATPLRTQVHTQMHEQLHTHARVTTELSTPTSILPNTRTVAHTHKLF